ncbi:MAG TPA: carboxylesterase family protein [Blastocatellia bacterium]|nr:carboxylesterase family protein [Blastocatellia bacterium]
MTKIFVLCCSLSLILALSSPTRAINSTVRVESGLLEGVSSPVPGVRVFKGIPYAAPPVGDLRWRPPQPPAKWEGVRKADKFSDSCVQNLARSRNPWTAEFMVQNQASEDCLCLNVWTGARSASERRPVFVWIHGGAFTEGSGEVAVYDGAELAKKGLVVVTINYRLGVFGFLTHPELTKESSRNASGNYGLLDVVAALEWAQKNIVAFGGDPQRVTIAGQSAGAFAVHALTASPLADGLFHRAIAESGSGVGRRNRILAEAEKDGVKFAESKSAHSIRDLRAMSANDLTGAGGARFGPVVDGWFLPADATAIFAQGKQNDVPMLTGLTADEGSASPTYGKIKAEEFKKQSQQRFGDLAEAFLKFYPSDDDPQSGLSQKQSAREQGMISMRLWAAERARTSKSKTWTYYFSRAIPWPEQPQYGAFHTSEVPYVFGNLKLLDRPWEPVDRRLSATMMTYWARFATTGDPNGKGLPQWPAFDVKNRITMEFGEKTGTRSIADTERTEFFEKFFARQRAQ